MTTKECIFLAWAALNALDSPEQIESVVEGVLGFAGYPLPTFLSPIDDARWWASFANLKEQKASALPAYEALPIKAQMAFGCYLLHRRVSAQCPERHSSLKLV